MLSKLSNIFKTTLSLCALSAVGIVSLPITAQAAPPPPEAFGKLPEIYDASLSPDASKIAVIMNIKGEYRLSISDLKDADAGVIGVRLENGIKPQYIKWANSEQILFSFWQSEEFRGTPLRAGYLYSYNIKSRKGRILIDPRGQGELLKGSKLQRGDLFRQFNNVVVDFLEDDPDHILMAFSETDNNVSPAIHRVNVETGKYKTIRNGDRDIQQWITDRTGTPRLGQGLKKDESGEWVMKIKDAREDEWHFVKDHYPGLEPDTAVYGFTSNPDELIVGAYNGKDTIGLYVYDLSKKSITRDIYHNDEYDATGVVLSKDGDEIIGARFTGDTEQTEMIGDNDTYLQSLRRKFPSHNMDFIDQSSDGETMLIKMSHAYDPGLLGLYKAGSDAPVALGYYHPQLKSNMLGEVIGVKYKARDGQKIPAYVTIPPTITDASKIKKLPFIVLPHGGPYARDSKRFDYFAQFFASRGYGVLQMNFRGSEGYGKSFEEAGRQNWTVMQDDVEDGTRWLLEKGYADPERVCIAGWSYGGYASLMGAAKSPDLYACSIAMAALTDIKDFIKGQERYRFGSVIAENFIGRGFEDKDDIKANSPVKIAGDMTVPLFLAHGELDQQVDFNQYQRMKSALKKSKAKVTYMEFEDGDHYLSNQENRQDFFVGLDKFLKKHVGESEFSP